jgi:hypothetical protein
MYKEPVVRRACPANVCSAINRCEMRVDRQKGETRNTTAAPALIALQMMSLVQYSPPSESQTINFLRHFKRVNLFQQFRSLVEEG